MSLGPFKNITFKLFVYISHTHTYTHIHTHIYIYILAERSDTKSNVKLDGFRSRLQTSYVSSHTEEFWLNETVCLWMTIYKKGLLVNNQQAFDIPLDLTNLFFFFYYSKTGKIF